MPYLIRHCVTYMLIASLSFSLPFNESAAQSKIHAAPSINASAGKDCFKSLDAKDMENLGSILYLRERTASSLTPVTNDYDAQRKAIDANFTGAKREAAYALLTSAIATSNDSLLKQVMNQALARGQTQLNDNDKKQISHLIDQGLQNGVDIVSMLNLRTASMSPAAEILKSKGAKLTANGEWNFDADFNFNEIKNDPILKESLSIFFPEQVKELSQPWRGYTVIGNRIVMNSFDVHQKGKNKDWYWESASIEDHTKKTVEILDRFTRKAEEYARLSKENWNWVKMLDASTSANLVCGTSMKDILGGPVLTLARHFSGDRNHEMQDWENGLDKLSRVHRELLEFQTELIIHGATDETKNAVREATAKVTSKSDDDMNAGIKGMKTALVGIACAPLVVLTAPISLPAAGATATAATLAYAGAALTVISLATPVVMAGRNVYQAVKNGDGALCSVVKHGAIVPVKFVNTLKWGAMGPVIKSLGPVLSPMTKFLNLGAEGSKYAVLIPSFVLSGKGAYDSNQARVQSNEAIAKIEIALKDSKERGNLAHTRVLEEMLRDARDKKWESVIGLLSSTVGLLDATYKVVGKSADPIEQRSLSNKDDLHVNRKNSLGNALAEGKAEVKVEKVADVKAEVKVEKVADVKAEVKVEKVADVKAEVKIEKVADVKAEVKIEKVADGALPTDKNLKIVEKAASVIKTVVKEATKEKSPEELKKEKEEIKAKALVNKAEADKLEQERLEDERSIEMRESYEE